MRFFILFGKQKEKCECVFMFCVFFFVEFFSFDCVCFPLGGCHLVGFTTTLSAPLQSIFFQMCFLLYGRK